MPGTDPVQIKDGADGGSVDFGGNNSTGDASSSHAVVPGGGSLSLNQRSGGNGSVTLEVEGDRVGVSAVEETNTLLVRASATAWKSIKDVIEKLDVMPLQVHIEAQIAEVQLTGALEYGVNWYFENAVTTPFNADGPEGLPYHRRLAVAIWGDIAGSITGSAGLGWTFLGRNAAAVVSALDKVTNLRLLQTPSVFVRNNVEATFNVGSRIPIQSVSFNPGTGTDGTYSQVQYLDTGVILKVRPRITRDGMVFLEIVQEVSSPGSVADANGNVRIDTRRLKTEAAIRNGDTVLLAGLISDSVDHGSSGVPFLSKIPVVGALFGTKTANYRTHGNHRPYHANDRAQSAGSTRPHRRIRTEVPRPGTSAPAPEKVSQSPAAALPVILLPVGVDDDALDACLGALDAGTPAGARIWLADDAQAGPRASAIIERWLKRTPLQADYTRRQSMIGEVAHLDEMLNACARADVVVLAPDAQPLPGWLQQLSPVFPAMPPSPAPLPGAMRAKPRRGRAWARSPRRRTISNAPPPPAQPCRRCIPNCLPRSITRSHCAEAHVSARAVWT